MRNSANTLLFLHAIMITHEYLCRQMLYSLVRDGCGDLVQVRELAQRGLGVDRNLK